LALNFLEIEQNFLSDRLIRINLDAVLLAERLKGRGGSKN